VALSLDDLKKLSPKVKALIVCLLYVVLGYLYYMLFLQGALDKQANLSTKLTDLQKQVVEKEKTVAQIDGYLREIKSLKEVFTVALQKLPDQKEIPDLLAAVATSGKGAGMDFLIFEPTMPEKKPPEVKGQPPKPVDAKGQPQKPADAKGQPPKPGEPEKFYEDLPIKVQVTGGFHNTLSFFDQIARLPRIINIEDVVMADVKEVKGKGRILKTSCTLKTYMFMDKK
jgi:type IV pilus assembly protein PilO